MKLKSSREISRNESIPQPDSAERFHFWLIISMLTVFIFLLFYSQKIQGLM